MFALALGADLDDPNVLASLSLVAEAIADLRIVARSLASEPER